MVYKEEISATLATLEHADSSGLDATGVHANLRCGCVVRFGISFEPEKARVAQAGFASNGCGYMVAAAEAAASIVAETPLVELKGDAAGVIGRHVRSIYGDAPAERLECISAVVRSAASAFANYRARQAAEFRGEIALICTCFAVTEDKIRDTIAARQLTTVRQVGEATNAGTGCGSCQMLIRELLDEEGVIEDE